MSKRLIPVKTLRVKTRGTPMGLKLIILVLVSFFDALPTKIMFCFQKGRTGRYLMSAVVLGEYAMFKSYQ